MASACKLNGKWRVLIRRKGHGSISKRFSTKAVSEAWAREIRGQIAVLVLAEALGAKRFKAQPGAVWSAAHSWMKR